MKINKKYSVNFAFQFVLLLLSFKAFAQGSNRGNPSAAQDPNHFMSQNPLLFLGSEQALPSNQVFDVYISISTDSDFPAINVTYDKVRRVVEIVHFLNSREFNDPYFTNPIIFTLGETDTPFEGLGTDGRIISQNQRHINKSITLIDNNGVEHDFYYSEGRRDLLESAGES